MAPPLVQRASSPLARGFTLIELIVVMSIIALLLTLALPRYFHSLDNGRIMVQRQNIATLRDAIDKFFGDQGRYPDTLDELVTKRYLREVPLDPLTERRDWATVAPQDTTQGAVYDVRPPEQQPAADARPPGG
jgi:general secretion pathway protein G